MQINFTGHHLEITPALKSFTEEKFDKLERHFDIIMSASVTFEVNKPRQIAEATVFVPKATLHASSECENMYMAVDELVEKLDRQLSKHKDKHKG